MASKQYDVGNEPPQVVWTVVRGDTASFRVYVTDDARQPITVTDWSIEMDINRSGSTILTLTPYQDPDDSEGEFTVFLTAAESRVLETDDIFDIQLSLAQDQLVWTVAQGKMFVIEDITD